MAEKIGNYGEYADPVVQKYFNAYTSTYGGGVIIPQGYTHNIGQSKCDWRRFTTRYRHGGHLLFAGGHVAWVSWLQAQIQPDQLPGGQMKNTSDANQPDRLELSALGPVQ